MKPGDIISRYRIVGPLGKGGMGVVYRAEDTRLQRPVALKFLPHDSFTESEERRFLHEARAAAAVRHPNICPIYDIEEADGEMFIVMACLEGETLHRRTARGPLPPAEAAAIAVQVAAGLQAAHELGIIHRDIKSGNIIVSPSGQASILDFGLALASGATRVTSEGSTVGTAAYMSPEQAQGLTVDPRSDIWSLGVLLFEMLTGTLPFRRDHRSAALHAILFDPVPQLASLREDIPPEFQHIVDKALAKSPGHRWQTAREISAELKRIQDTLPQQASPETVSTESMSAVSVPSRMYRWGLLAVAAALLIAGGLGAYRFVEGRRPAAPPAQTAAQPAAHTRQVAVLPFQVAEGDDATRSVADGLAEVLAAALSDFERFRGAVTAVPSSEIRRLHITTPEQARRTYGADLVISGSAAPDGKQVKLTMNLVDAATLQQIDTGTVVYDPAHPLASRDQAVALAGRMMKVQVPPAAHTVISQGDTAAPDAYSAYLRGRGLLARYDVTGNIDKAIAAFTTAAKQDPKYALAFAGIAEAYWRQMRAKPDPKWLSLAVNNAEHAVALDPHLALVHSVLGTIYGEVGRREDAIRELREAMDLAPSNAEAPRQLAEVYRDMGRFDDAEALYVRATTSRPTDWYGHALLGIFYYQRERYAQAEAELNRAKDLTPDNEVVYRNLGAVYRMQGRYGDAIRELEKGIKVASNPINYAALAGAYFAAHRFPESVSAAEAAIDLDSSDYRFWGNLGVYCKWAPGSEVKSAPAIRRAIELAQKKSEATPADFNLRANLAEYHARLGEAPAALAEIDRIPPAVRKLYITRLATAFELTGHRDRAIELIHSNVTSQATLNQMKDDPDLAPLWADPSFQKAIRTARGPSQKGAH